MYPKVSNVPDREENVDIFLIRIYDRKKPPFLFLTKDEDHHMNMHYTFSVREVSEVRDNEQVLKVRKYKSIICP